MSLFKEICKYEDNITIWKDYDFKLCFQQVFIISPPHLLLCFIGIYCCVQAICRTNTSRTVHRSWFIFFTAGSHLGIICSQIFLIMKQIFATKETAILILVVESLILLAWVLSSLFIFLKCIGCNSLAHAKDFNLLKLSWIIAMVSCSFELYSAILYSFGYPTPLVEGVVPFYKSIDIYIRWTMYLVILLLQIPKLNEIHENLPIVGINIQEEAGSSSHEYLHAPQTVVSEDSFSHLSKIFFCWVSKLFDDAKSNQFISVNDLSFTLPQGMNPITNHCKLKLAVNHYNALTCDISAIDNSTEGIVEDMKEPLLQDYKDKKVKDNLSRFVLLKSLNTAFGWSFWPLNILKLISAIFEICSPVLLNLFLHELESNSPSISSAAIYLGLLLLVLTLNAFIDTHLSYQINKLQISMRGSIITELFSKVLSVNWAGLRSYSIGKITNFAAQDSDNISSHLICLFEIWYLPLKLVMIFYLLYKYVGISFLAGIGFCILLIPINQVIAKKLHGYNDRLLTYRDSRLKLVHEVMGNMKSIKFFAWEEQFIEKIEKIRNLEIFELNRIANFDALCVYFWASAPCLITFSIVLTYSFIGDDITASTIFTTLALVDQVIIPLNALPWVIMGFIKAWISLQRVQKFFGLADNSPIKKRLPPPFEEQNAIEVDNCSFYWNDSEDCCLLGLQFQVNKGELMVVSGKTGSGKSSLLLALSQELNLASGEIRINEWKEGAGIVLQECWIKSGTIRETILDGCSFDLYWYEKVVSACALDKDISCFPDGDSTLVGVEGGALSGGQRLRLSLARAVYKNKEVYFIDDVFSGLDSHVVLHIIENCINGLLARKTRIVCTHNKHLASLADTLLILENKQIKYIGLPQMMNVPESLKTTRKPHPECCKSSEEETENKINQYEEPRRYGSVEISVYKHYSVAAGVFLTSIVLLSLFGMQGTETLSNWWLSFWIKSASKPSNQYFSTFSQYTPWHLLTQFKFPLSDEIAVLQIRNTAYSLGNDTLALTKSDSSSDKMFYLTVYGSLIAANTLFTLIRAFSFAAFGISATTKLHRNMLKSVMNTAMHFFDNTPVGVIINRFSSDIYSVDSDLPFTLNILMAELFILLGTLTITSYGLPYILLIIIPLLVIYRFIQKYYITAVREVKRLYSTVQSPLFNYFDETTAGLVYIHSFRGCNAAFTSGIKYLEAFQRSSFCLSAASAWLSLRLQLLAGCLVGVASAIILVEMHYRVADATILGLALTYALSINSTLKGLIICLTEVEKEFIGAERILQYTHGLPIEVDQNDIPTIDFIWPTSGTIHFSGVSAQYKNCDTKALKDISFSIKAAEKVAIVGRTGAGKSTVFLALFKLMDLESGCIIIDDINIENISSKFLREQIAIIPQKPLIFSGTVKENLDPFNKYKDEKITESLNKCQLSEFTLDSVISSKTLSSGQCQLFSLARVLLDRSKILCLDEAISNVDHETTQLIQKVIRKEYWDSTIVTVAHRIETILDYDRVIVMAHGGIVENGCPKVLMQSRSSLLYNLAQSSGIDVESFISNISGR